MENKNLNNIKELIKENINDAISLTDLQMRLDIIHKKLQEIKREKKRKLYSVKTIERSVS